jgi:protein translocase SecG subunit
MNTLIDFLPSIQIVLSILMVIVILLQQSDESLGGTFGGSDSVDTIKRTRRGMEKVLFKSSIIIAILFVITSIFSFLLK